MKQHKGAGLIRSVLNDELSKAYRRIMNDPLNSRLLEKEGKLQDALLELTKMEQEIHGVQSKAA